jgi:hypothetical protein
LSAPGFIGKLSGAHRYAVEFALDLAARRFQSFVIGVGCDRD